MCGPNRRGPRNPHSECVLTLTISPIARASAVRLLLDLLTQMGEGNAVTLIPYHAEMTTQQCADLLNVSRKHFVDEILGKGLVPHRKVGTHRRVRFEDLMAFRRRDDEARDKTLDELTALSQEMGLE